MPKRSSKRRPRDINQLAKDIVDESTSDGQPEAPVEDTGDTEGKNPAAVASLRPAVCRARRTYALLGYVLFILLGPSRTFVSPGAMSCRTQSILAMFDADFGC